MKELKKTLIKLKESDRLHGLQKPIIALTGGIATGKSTVARILKSRGIHILDADQMVKGIYKTKEAQDFIKNNFPSAWNDGINFSKLRELVFQDIEVKSAVEKFIYARLPEAFQEAAAKSAEEAFLLYDVPLLYERQMEEKVDVVILVYAPRQLQLERLMKRDAADKSAAERILDQQMDIEDKKKKADFIIDNSGAEKDLAAKVESLLLQILE